MIEQDVSRVAARPPLPQVQRRGGLRRWLLRLCLAAAIVLVSLVVANGRLVREPAPTLAISLRINGAVRTVQTRQSSVGALLYEQGYRLGDMDIVYPPAGARLEPSRPISVLLARDVTYAVGERHGRALTHATLVADFLLEQHIELQADDVLLVNDRPLAADAPMPIATQPGERPVTALRIVPAVPISVSEGGHVQPLSTHAGTVGEALFQQGIVLHEGDRVTPTLDAPLLPGLAVQIERGHPVTLVADGHASRTRTHAPTVEAVLAEAGIQLRSLDQVTPALNMAVGDELAVRVTRVDRQVVVENVTLPHESRTEYRSDLELDSEGLVQSGRDGILTRETVITYVDGEEQGRETVREVVELAAQDEIYGIGTRVVVRTVSTEQGPRPYWRRIRMLATSYTAATSGKSRDHPAYGITRLGLQAGFGIVAVDPRVVPLGSYVYVPGYGVAIAGDTGGAIKGRRIDLGYDEWNLRLWYNTVDVYLLTPAPPASSIPYQLP